DSSGLVACPRRRGDRVRRREFMSGLGVAAVMRPLPSLAQRRARVSRIGFLHPGLVEAANLRIAAVREGLRDQAVEVISTSKLYARLRKKLRPDLRDSPRTRDQWRRRHYRGESVRSASG